MKKIFNSYIQKRHLVYEIFGVRLKFRIKPISLKSYQKLPTAVLNFNYADFETLKKSFKETGKISINIGDYIQSHAVRSLCSKYTPQICTVNRDTLQNYKGRKIKLFCNSVMWEKQLHYNKKIEPIFLGLSLANDKKNIDKCIDDLKLYEPIGCRDIATVELLKSKGVKAFLTGCYSITLPKRKNTPKEPKVFFVGISAALKEHIPPEMMKNAEFIIQRDELNNFPLTEKEMQLEEEKAAKLLERYRDEATLVVSPLLHCISPCIGMGIPVILARDTYNDRFSAISKITKLYLEEDYDKIDWNPEPVDVEDLKKNMRALAKEKLLNNNINETYVNNIKSFYGQNTWSEQTPHWEVMERRIKFMLNMIDLKEINSLMDLGCGKINTKKYLPQNVEYTPVDFIKYDESVIQKDFNAGEFHFKQVDVVFCSGVFEYIYDLDAFAQKISQCTDTILASYIFYGDRPKPSYVVNKYNEEEFFGIFEKYGFKLENIIREDEKNNIGRNTVFLLKKIK